MGFNYIGHDFIGNNYIGHDNLGRCKAELSHSQIADSSLFTDADDLSFAPDRSEVVAAIAA